MSWNPRHVDIVLHAARGLSDREIGERLFISGNTVKRHLRNAYQEHHARNRAHLVFLAFRAGVITTTQREGMV